MLNEMKKYVLLHAKTLGVDKEASTILRNIKSLDDSIHGWGYTFFRAAEKAEKRKNTTLALGLYNIARFPYPKTPIQIEAYQRYLDFFKNYYISTYQFEEKTTKDAQQKFYLKTGRYNDIVILCGGIISLKEQWVNAANIFHSMGFSVILTEMPAVGENKTPYNKNAFSMFSDILDVIGYSEKNNCHLIAMSFSGHIALMNSFIDKRIKAITMVGTPIYDLYHNYDTFFSLPDITKDILRKNTHCIAQNRETFNYLSNEFSHEIIKNPHLNIFYLQSQFDDIISLTEADHLQDKFGNFHKLCLPDEHGSPNYHKTVIFYIAWSVLQHSRKKWPLRLLLAGMTSLSRRLYQIKHIFFKTSSR